jgi:hypothetical protein
MVANTTKGTDLASLYCMIKNCGQKIVDCVSDKTCKGGLDCLEGCAFNDQVQPDTAQGWGGCGLHVVELARVEG